MRVAATVTSHAAGRVRGAAATASPATGLTCSSHEVAAATDVGVARTAAARGDDLPIRQLARPGAHIGRAASAARSLTACSAAVVSGRSRSVAAVAADLDVQRVTRGNRQLSGGDGCGAARQGSVAVATPSARRRHRQTGDPLGNRERLRAAGERERAGHLGSGALDAAGRQHRRRGNRDAGGEQPRGTDYGEATHSGRVPPAA
ncbi:hypothetical protein ROP_13970 [Rhodococcus opacus B4]|uniref:Uncharacterized protein n=1 Tax=Rhodococcus opacus (strain B4) TaxID=632772 RepID=C1AXE0_RHOOB|nr:hypothetical protein ROP_13970 [Rhodococcus opacus B4]